MIIVGLGKGIHMCSTANVSQEVEQRNICGVFLVDLLLANRQSHSHQGEHGHDCCKTGTRKETLCTLIEIQSYKTLSSVKLQKLKQG
jgi:hypothetical protein